MMDDQQKLLKRLNRRSRFTQFLAWLALFFTAVGIAAGYKNWLRIHDKAKAGLKGIEEIRQELPEFAKKSRVAFLEKELNENLKENKVHLDKAIRELRTIQDSTQHIAETVYTQVESLTKQQEGIARIQTPSIRDWSLGEVHFLLQTAIQRFRLNQDKKGAITAFKLADSLLVKRGSLEFLPLRKQISHDIATLRQFATPDLSALSAKIDNLLKQLEPAPESLKNKGNPVDIFSRTNQVAVPTSDPKTEAVEANKESLVNRVKETINSAVVIRKFNKPIQTEMALEQREQLFHLLSLRLETLRIMLLQGDDTSYHNQIERIKTLIKDYYPTQQNARYVQQLERLDNVSLAYTLPDISSSLKLLEQIMTNNKGEQP